MSTAKTTSSKPTATARPVASPHTDATAATSGVLPSKPVPADLPKLSAQLHALGLTFAAEALTSVLTQAVKQVLSPPAFLATLLEAEQSSRVNVGPKVQRPTG